MNRRTFIKILAAALASSQIPAHNAFASTDEGGAIELTEDVALEFADNVAACYSNDSRIRAVSSVGFCKTAGSMAGRMVSFEKDGVPAGYLVIDPSAKGCIGEFSFTEGATSPFEHMASSLPATTDADAGYMPIQIAPFQYGVLDLSTGSVYAPGAGSSVAGKPSLTLDLESTSASTTTWQNAMISQQDLSKYTSFEAGWSSDVMYYLSQDEVINATGRYACLVSAAYCIAAFYGATTKALNASNYLRLWDVTQTSVMDTDENGNELGETYPSPGALGCTEFCASAGVTVGQSTDLLYPSFSRFTSSVNDCNCGMFHTAINVLDDGEVKRSGHTMMYQGYMIATRKSDGTQCNLLVVADGWNEGFACVNYDYSGLTEHGGSFFWT